MRRGLAMWLVLVCGSLAAQAQEPACNLYRVNTSLLPISTEAGGQPTRVGCSTATLPA
jgi:hypothetical protein